MNGLHGGNRNFLFERGEVEAHLHETSSHEERQAGRKRELIMYSS